MERPDREGPTWFLKIIGVSAERRAAVLEGEGDLVGARALYASALAHQLTLGRRGETSLRAVARLRAKSGDAAGARADYLRVISESDPDALPDLAIELLVLVEPALAGEALRSYPLRPESATYDRYLTAAEQLARVDPTIAVAVHENQVAQLRSLPPGELVPQSGPTRTSFALLAEETRRARRAAESAGDPDAALRHEAALEALLARANPSDDPGRSRPRIWTLDRLVEAHGRNAGLADAIEDACARIGSLPAAVLRMQATLLAAATADDALQASYRAQALQLRHVVEQEALEHHRTLDLVQDPDAPVDIERAARHLAGRDYFHGIVYGLRMAPWFSGAAIAGLVEDGEAVLASDMVDPAGCTARLSAWSNDLRRLSTSMAARGQANAHLCDAHLRAEAALLSDARATTEDEVQTFESYVDEHLRRFGIDRTLAAIAPARAMRSTDSGPWPEARWLLLRGEVCERHARTSPDEAASALQLALADFARAASTGTGRPSRAHLRRALADPTYHPVKTDALRTVAAELEDTLPPASALEAAGRTYVLSAYRQALATVPVDERWHDPDDVARTIVRTADAGCINEAGEQIPDHGLNAALAALGAGDQEMATLLSTRFSKLMVASYADPRTRSAIAPQAEAIVAAFQLAAGIMSGTVIGASDRVTELDTTLRTIDSTPGAGSIARDAVAIAIDLVPDFGALTESTEPSHVEHGNRRSLSVEIFDDDEAALADAAGIDPVGDALDRAAESDIDFDGGFGIG